jgi:hypothetical protein
LNRPLTNPPTGLHLADALYAKSADPIVPIDFAGLSKSAASKIASTATRAVDAESLRALKR